jgi:hypothetical protein
MSTTNILIIVAVALVVLVALSMVMARQKKTKQLHGQFKPEYDLTVKNLGGEKQAQAELDERQKHFETLQIHPLSESDHERYMADWAAIQSKFVDGPGKAVADADRLTIEAMIARGYPVSDFDQRAADISIAYPGVVTSYRAAREISLKNEQKLADTEELRQAFIYYRSLFEELIKSDTK